MVRDLAVGIDLIDVGRFARAVGRWPGLLKRLFTSEEIDVCRASRNADERLAARFAAKEAAFKALGDGWPMLTYHDVEIRLLDGGAPTLSLSGRAAELAGRRAIVCSMTHGAGLALAEVILQGTKED